jgi:hypothetical protein
MLVYLVRCYLVIHYYFHYLFIYLIHYYHLFIHIHFLCFVFYLIHCLCYPFAKNQGSFQYLIAFMLCYFVLLMVHLLFLNFIYHPHFQEDLTRYVYLKVSTFMICLDELHLRKYQLIALQLIHHRHFLMLPNLHYFLRSIMYHFFLRNPN